MTDAFEVRMHYSFDFVTTRRNMPRPYWSRIGYQTLNHVGTKRQKRLCDRSGHPKNAIIRRGDKTACARCGRLA